MMQSADFAQFSNITRSSAHTVHMTADFSALIIRCEPRHILAQPAPGPFAFSLQVATAKVAA